MQKKAVSKAFFELNSSLLRQHLKMYKINNN